MFLKEVNNASGQHHTAWSAAGGFLPLGVKGLHGERVSTLYLQRLPVKTSDVLPAGVC